MKKLTTDNDSNYIVNHVMQMSLLLENTITEELEKVKVKYAKEYNYDSNLLTPTRMFALCEFNDTELLNKFNSKDWIVSAILYDVYGHYISSEEDTEDKKGTILFPHNMHIKRFDSCYDFDKKKYVLS